jgi:hypothetical protein
MSCHVCWCLISQFKLDGLAAREDSVPQGSACAQKGAFSLPASAYKLIKQLQRRPWQAIQARCTARLASHVARVASVQRSTY